MRAVVLLTSIPPALPHAKRLLTPGFSALDDITDIALCEDDLAVVGGAKYFSSTESVHLGRSVRQQFNALN
jgi:hypothetical protein